MEKQERDRLFSELFEANRAKVRKAVRRTLWNGSDDEVDDLVQEVMIKAWLAFDPARTDTFVAWLMMTAKRSAYGLGRTKLTHARLQKRFALESEASVDGVHGPLEEARTNMAVAEALAGLGPSVRAIVSLHAEGKSTREIARLVGLHRDTVGKRLAQGLKRLRRQLVTHA